MTASVLSMYSTVHWVRLLLEFWKARIKATHITFLTFERQRIFILFSWKIVYKELIVGRTCRQEAKAYSSDVNVHRRLISVSGAFAIRSFRQCSPYKSPQYTGRAFSGNFLQIKRWRQRNFQKPLEFFSFFYDWAFWLFSLSGTAPTCWHFNWELNRTELIRTEIAIGSSLRIDSLSLSHHISLTHISLHTLTLWPLMPIVHITLMSLSFRMRK